MKKYVKKPLLVKQCQCCNKDFKTKQERKIFCSNLCYSNYHYNQNRDLQTRQCKNCNKDFIAYRVNKIFCSQDCQWNYRYKTKRQQLVKIECKECNKKFVRKCSGHKYCSAKCRNKSTTCQGYVHTVRRKDGTYVSKHRYVIEQSIGRKLETSEIVHHIDMNKENNNEDNLQLFGNGTKHGLCHGSLNKIVEILISKNIIVFDENHGIYNFLE